MSSLFVCQRLTAGAVLLALSACSPLAGPDSMTSRQTDGDRAVQPRRVTLDAQFDVARYGNGQARSTAIRYQLRNNSDADIAVLIPGAPESPQPSFLITAEGDLSIALQMRPPLGLAAVPDVIVAQRVAAGESVALRVDAALLTAYPNDTDPVGLIAPRRLRLCQAYAPFDETLLVRSQRAARWRARPQAHRHQAIVCSAWFELSV